MRGITIKLPEATLRRLGAEAKATDRSIAAVVRERLDAGTRPANGTLQELAGDLAGALAGSPLAATNERRKFRARMIHICDTGPLVAWLNRNDPYHAWAVAAMRDAPTPLLVCEPVLTEAACFLREDGLDVAPLFAMIERAALRLAFDMNAHWPRLRTLMMRYPRMDLADACVVAMSEQHRHCRVLTVDRRDFSTYRRNDRQAIDFVAPPA